MRTSSTTCGARARMRRKANRSIRMCFPIRNATRPPKELTVRAGYYCIDTFTPINRNAFPAAKRAVDCVLTAADEILDGRRIAYALVRPPGHHAERRSFGGFCYFSNSAIGAQLSQPTRQGGDRRRRLSPRQRATGHLLRTCRCPDGLHSRRSGLRVSVLHRIRGRTRSRRGRRVQPEHSACPRVQDGAQYRKALDEAIQAVRDFAPAFLVIALGLDPAKGDPTGTWSLAAKDFEANGRMLGSLRLPTLVVQEGGYRTRTLGKNAKSFFRGLMDGSSRRRQLQADARTNAMVIRTGRHASRTATRCGGSWKPPASSGRTKSTWPSNWSTNGWRRARRRATTFCSPRLDGSVVGYACYGPIACTLGSYDLYWIAVDPDWQGTGTWPGCCSAKSNARSSSAAAATSTSKPPAARSTRRRERSTSAAAIEIAAVLADFYDRGDDKVIWRKACADETE